MNARTRQVLITGGTGSVGQALIRRFSEAGDQVTFQYAQNEAKASHLSSEYGAAPVQLDFTRPFELPPGAYDVVINNAAVNIADEITHLVSLQSWSETLAVNLTAPFLIVRHCLPHMLESGGGCFVNISSIYGLRATEENLPYTVSKHGLSGLTKTVAREYAKDHIRCNEICPGPIASELMQRIADRAALRDSSTASAYMEEVLSEIPAGKMCLPEDVANLAFFLASEEAAYLNGASIPLDGGLIA